MSTEPLRPGDLVEITRASIGVPPGTIALITEAFQNEGYDDWTFTVWPTGEVGKRGVRRYLSRDLKRLTNTLQNNT